MFWRKSAKPISTAPVAQPVAAFVRLHEQAVNRRYDLRVCNPAHGGFYAFMARYKDVADDPAALDILVEEITARQAALVYDADLAGSFGQLAELARWRARMLRAAGSSGD